ncbi:MAG: tetratricopeptide repeat protein [Planctomycetota bacterium]
MLACGLLALVVLLAGCTQKEESSGSLPPRPDLGELRPAVREVISRAYDRAEGGRAEDLANLARVLHAHAFHEVAVQVYDLALAKNGGAFPEVYLSGLAAYWNDRDEARRRLERAVAIRRDYPAAWLWLGRVHAEAGENLRAREAFLAADRLLATAYGSLGLARSFMVEGPERDLRRARSHLEQALAIDRRLPSVHAAWARYWRLTGDARRAAESERLAKDAVKERGFPDPILLEVSLLSRTPSGVRTQIDGLLAMGQAEEALRRAERYLAEDPGSLDAKLFRANALLRLQRHADVIAATDELLRAAPGEADYMVLRANALFGLGRQADAVRQLEAAVAADPENVGARYTLGVLLGPVDARAARTHMRWVLENAPLRHPEVRSLLARVEDSLGQRDEAARLLAEALAFDPQDATALQMKRLLGL